MKFTLVLALVVVAAVNGFAPASQGRVGSQLNESLFDAIANMDLFAPKKDQNSYGARANKNLKVGDIQQGKSYVPNGLSAAQYQAIRAKEQKKKDDNYKRNVAKAGVFEDYTEFYVKRGTDTKQAWAKDVNLGHRMAKTKFDWSGKKVAATTTAAVKAAPAKKKRFGKK
eukprot:jgi/Psemu1/327328/estExt_fgenesh1_pg.C_6180007